MRAPFFVLSFMALLIAPAGPGAEPLAGGAAVRCPAPRPYRFDVTGQLRRDQPGFTEGLEVHDGRLYESTGDVFGETRINVIDLGTGKVSALRNDHHSYFGEGLTFFGGRLYQMSWREHLVFVFDKLGRRLKVLHNPREGWGLTHDAVRLIASDGSSRLFFLSPRDFSTLGSVTVRYGGQPVGNLNELEYVDGAIWANVFESWQVVKIAPATGCVLGVADLHGLYDRLSPDEKAKVDADGNFVLNGIAHDPAGGQFILTGKYWPVLFTGRFVEK
jgi:glutaminyl-peptide cyclotransferase